RKGAPHQEATRELRPARLQHELGLRHGSPRMDTGVAERAPSGSTSACSGDGEDGGLRDRYWYPRSAPATRARLRARACGARRHEDDRYGARLGTGVFAKIRVKERFVGE